jgi:hypothetical protein
MQLRLYLNPIAVSFFFLIYSLGIMLSLNRRSLALWAFALSAFDAVAHPLLSGHIVSRADELLSEYDYVIVGGGASGLTVANRLTEEPGKS